MSHTYFSFRNIIPIEICKSKSDTKSFVVGKVFLEAKYWQNIRLVRDLPGFHTFLVSVYVLYVAHYHIMYNV